MRVSEVLAVDGREIKVDDSSPTTADHYADPGDDSLPLAGDFAALEETTGSGLEQAVGYHDPDVEQQKSSPGEKRIYARDAQRTLVAEIWLKGDGTLVLKSVAAESGGEITLAPSGVITLNGVTIDPDGNITTPGDIDAQGDIDSDGTVTGAELKAGALAMSTHVHPETGATTTGPVGP